MGSWNLHAAAWSLPTAFPASFRGHPKDSAAETTPALFLPSSDAGSSGLLTVTAVELRDAGLASVLAMCWKFPAVKWTQLALDPIPEKQNGWRLSPIYIPDLYAIDSQMIVVSLWVLFLLTFLLWN